MTESVPPLDPRVAALHAYGLLDTPTDPAFDDLAALARAICGTRYAVVNLVDADRQWFKAEIGFGVRELPLDDSICARVMLDPELVEIPDLTADERFRCNPLITAGPQLRFYAGAPLRDADGHVLGTLCVLDDAPRRLDAGQREALAALGRQTVAQMELWRRNREHEADARRLAAALAERERAEAELRASTQAAMRNAEAAEHERRRLQAMLEATPVGLAFADADGRLVDMNPALRDIWGDYPASYGVGGYAAWKGWWPADGERAGARLEADEWPMARALRGEAVRGAVIDIEPFGQPGVRRTLLLHSAPVRDAAGRLIGAVTAQQDITDRVRAEHELRVSEARLRRVFEVSPIGMVTGSRDGQVHAANDAFLAIIGRDRAELEAARLHCDVIVPPDQLHLHAAALAEVDRSGRSSTYEKEYVRPDGTRVPVLLAVARFGDDGELIAFVIGIGPLMAAQRALKAASDRKDEFLAMLAHELRNPLAPISTAAELLRLPGSTPAQVERASAIIARQVRHMTELVDDLLDVSRVTRGLVTLEREAFDLREAVRAAIEQVRPLVESRRHVLSTRLSGAPLPVTGDRTRLTQVLANLLNNAAKYTPPGGTISIEARRAGAQVRVEVADTGSGIEADLLPHVFDLFVQGRRTPDRSQGGLGIGLALVKSLVALHGGDIHAASDGPGQGSTFTLELEAAAEAVPEMPVAAPVPAMPSRLRIHVVDDNEDAASTLGALLEAYGHAVETFGSGEAVLARAQAAPADVYLLDIGLPGMDGHELARRLRRAGGDRPLALFAVSGYGQAADLRASREAGFDRHLVKPVDPGVLLEALRAVTDAVPR